MSSPFASLVTPAGDSAEPSPTPTFPVASPAAQAAFNALVQKMNKVPDDEPETDPQDDDESNTDESGEDESGEDESGTAAVTETEPEPVSSAPKRRARKPRVKRDTEPAEKGSAVDAAQTATDQTPREVALSHSPDDAWVILREQRASAENRMLSIHSEIESIKSTLEDLTKEYETSLQSFVERDEVIDTLSVALVNLSKGTPGIIGKVRITVIDGEVRIDPA